MFLFIATAHAYTIVCGAGLTVTDTVPGPSAADVPVDTRPAVTFGPACGLTAGWTVSLADAAAVELLSESSDFDTVAETGLLELFPADDFELLSEYILTITPASAEAVSVRFTTGETTVVGLTGAPAVTAAPATYNKESRDLAVGLTIVPANDPDQLSILQVRDAGGALATQSFVLPAAGQAERTVKWQDVDDPGELCIEVRQLDGAGVATAWVAAAECVPVKGCGCASGGAGAGLASVAFASLFAMRRRRQTG